MIKKYSPSFWKRIGNLLYPTVDAGIRVGGTQAGQSTIASGLVVNDSGGNLATDDFRAETVSNPNAFVVDASADKILIGENTEMAKGLIVDTNTFVVDSVNNRIGVNTATPQKALDLTSTTGTDRIRAFTTAAGGWIDTVAGSSAGNLYLAPVSGVVNLYDSARTFVQNLYNASTLAIKLNTNGDSYFNGGNLGLGITTPTTKLDILSADTVTNYNVPGIVNISSNDAFAIDKGGSITFGGKVNTAGTYRNFASIEGRKSTATDGGQNGYLVFNVNNNPTWTEAMRIISTGYIGMGINAPAYKLDVRGTSATDIINSNMGYNTDRVIAPTVPTATAVAGTGLSIGTYYYFITYTTAIGETDAGAVATVITTAGNEKVELTNIPISTDPRVIGRKIYRTKVGTTSDTEYFLATLANNTATTYTDTTPDASLTGVTFQKYKVNTTSKQITINGLRALFIDNNLTALGISAANNIIATSGAAIRSVFVGASAGLNVTTGQANTVVGGLAFYNATTAGNCTLVGDLAGYAMTTGGSNTAMGAQAARFITTGSGNIFMGGSSGAYLNDGSTSLTAPTSGVYLGRDTRGFSTTEDNAIVIGYRALGKGSNTVVIGNSSITQNYLSGNLNVPTAIIGSSTDNTTFEADGTLKMNGTATVYEDVNAAVAAAKTPATNFPDWTTFTTNTSAYTFKINDYADMGTIEIPHSYKEGSNLEVHLHLATNGTNNATARKVKYIVYYTYGIPDNGSNQFVAEASLTAELDIPANQLDKSTYYLSMGTITGTNIKIGTQLKMRIKRIAGTGTEPINDPFLGQVGVHFESDTIGSRAINSK